MATAAQRALMEASSTIMGSSGDRYTTTSITKTAATATASSSQSTPPKASPRSALRPRRPGHVDLEAVRSRRPDAARNSVTAAFDVGLVEKGTNICAASPSSEGKGRRDPARDSRDLAGQRGGRPATRQGPHRSDLPARSATTTAGMVLSPKKSVSLFCTWVDSALLGRYEVWSFTDTSLMRPKYGPPSPATASQTR